VNLWEILGVPVDRAGELTSADLRAAVAYHEASED
jgi:hypothetical protein